MRRPRFQSGFVAGALLLATPVLAEQAAAPAEAAPAAPAAQSAKPTMPWQQVVALGRSAQPTTLSIAPRDAGLELTAGKRVAMLPVDSLVDARVEPVTLSSGAVVAVVRVQGPGGQAAAAIVTRRRGQPEILFAGALDLRGDPGERRGHTIDVTDRTGDGIADVVVATRLERVHVCGQESTPLYPRAVDPARLELRPVVLNRLAAATEAVPEFVASDVGPGPQGQPVLRALGPATVSSLAGSRENGMQTPITALTDGDPKTFWHEGRGGGGRGEFATFRWDGGSFPLRALALTPLADPPPSSAGLSVPTRILLSGPGGARIAVTLPPDPTPGTRYWVVPPEPLAWGCLSVVFDTSHPLRGNKPGAAMLAEVEAYTDLDFGEGVPQLLSDLSGTGRSASAAADLLVTLGVGVVPAIADAFEGLSAHGKRRAVRILALHAKASSPARDALVKAVSEPELRERAIEALLSAGETGEAALLPTIRQQSALGDGVALALAKQAPMAVIDAVLAALSAPGGSERPALRTALTLAVQRVGAPALVPVDAWAQGPLPTLPALAGVALALASAERPAEARALAARMLDAARPKVDTFPELWRFVQASKSLPSESAADAWLTQLAHGDERWMLRAAALEALVRRRAPGALDVARARLADDYPRVRVAAASALGGRADALESLGALVREDRWAMVRAAALEALASTPGAGQTLAHGLSDKAQLVRSAAVRSLTTARARGAWPQVKERLLDDGEWPEVVTEAIAFARVMCVRDAAGGLLQVMRRGLEPNAWAPDQDVAVVAFDALLDLGGEAAKAAVSAARSPLAPAGFATAIEQTKHRKPACEAE